MRLKTSMVVVSCGVLVACGVPSEPERRATSSQHNASVQYDVSAAAAAPRHEASVSRRAAPVAKMLVQDNERYGNIQENSVKQVSQDPVSTFSADVDTGSYANVRRFLNEGRLPPQDAVRVEELINYFPLDAKLKAQSPHPFALATEVVDSPWLKDAKLLRIVIQAQEKKLHELPPANLVFLVDVSGSMYSPDKLPLAQKTLHLLTEQLRPQDKVTLITYASGTKVLISAASGRNKAALREAIDSLKAEGSTAGADAMEKAYEQAKKHYINDGINRILMMTDGDFNVGTVDFNTLKSRVAKQRLGGVSLTTLGFGTGNYNEQLMEQMADAGDGNYSYIDNEKEAKKVLQQQLTSTLATVASDVKIQVEFNPNSVSQYRLIGYENRLLNQEDFNNDQKDAGEVGAGHTVTALYEFVPQGKKGWLSESRYQTPKNTNAHAQEYAQVNVRYKPVNAQKSVLLSHIVPITGSHSLAHASSDTRFTIAVATYGQLLRDNSMVGNASWNEVSQWGKEAMGKDEFGLRREFLDLVDKARKLTPTRSRD